MQTNQGLEAVLMSWPQQLTRRGVAVTMQADQILFSNFSLGNGCVLLERATPDSVGGRMVIVPFDQLAAVKLTETPPQETLTKLGFS